MFKHLKLIQVHQELNITWIWNFMKMVLLKHLINYDNWKRLQFNNLCRIKSGTYLLVETRSSLTQYSVTMENITALKHMTLDNSVIILQCIESNGKMF
jgi:hypothetical protein